MRLLRSQRLNRYKEVEYEAAEYDPPKVILPAQQTQHHRALAPDRKPPPTAAPDIPGARTVRSIKSFDPG